jgi:hypothetical protein
MSLRWFGDPVVASLERAVMRGVVKGTELLRTDMVARIMNPPKSGRLYKRGKGRMHQASAAGESPANDTGNLARNITTKYDDGKLEGTVNVGTGYGRRLEYGFVGQDADGRTYDVAPRPFARPALQDKTAEIRQGIVDEIVKELSK